MSNVLGALKAFRKVAVENGDKKYDTAEIKQLEKIAKDGGDAFTTAGKSFLTCELASGVEFAPGAQQSLADVLGAQGTIDSAQGKNRLEAVLAFQDGSSNKFYTLAVEGKTLHTHWGPIGKAGQSASETFDSNGAADKAFTKALRSKLAKGYEAADPEALGIGAPGPASKPGDLKSFQALSPEAQAEAIEDPAKGGLKVLASQDIEDIEEPRQKAFASALRDAASDATGDFEIHDDEYLVVGDTRLSVELYLLPNGDVAGGEIYARQDGCERPDDYWDNEEKYDDKALRKLADDTDVSWSASGTYANSKDELTPVREPESMQWSGY